MYYCVCTKYKYIAKYYTPRILMLVLNILKIKMIDGAGTVALGYKDQLKNINKVLFEA